MKKIILPVGAALFCAFAFWELSHYHQLAATKTTAVIHPVRQEKKNGSHLPESKKTEIKAVPASALISDASSDDPLADFSRWTQQYLSADENTRASLNDEGRALAAARRPVFKTMIVEQPQEAIANAVPMVVRQKLPPEILAFLEKPVAARGVMRVYQAGPESVANGEKSKLRYVETVKGETYEAHVFGRRARSTAWVPNLSAIGVEIDGQLALDERPLRVLEAGEVPPVDMPRVNVCPVSKIETPLPPSTEPVTAATPALIANGEVVYLCDGSHTTLYEELLIQGESSSGGAQGFTGMLPATATPSVGVVKVLFIPAIFPDQNETPITEAGAYDMMKQTADFYQANSFGRLTLVATVTPPVRMPRNQAWYRGKDTQSGFIKEIDGLGLEMTHAKDAARRAGYDWQDYHATIVRANGGARAPTSFGGNGNVWMRVDSVSTATHEIGHAFLLDHANYWETNGASTIGPGGNVEYGDSYDNMGTGSPPNAHYNVQAKNQVKWMPDEFAPLITTSGIYRVYQMDQPRLDPGKRYGLRVKKDNDRTYWGEYRLLGGNNWSSNGLLLGWKWPSLPNGDGNNFLLLDTTPGSVNGKNDAGITAGRTFTDTENGIHITTLAVNSNTTPPSLDVVVNLGDFAGNSAPTLALSPAAPTVPLNTNVTFTATANDVDGDPLSYAWQWHDNTISGTGPTATRTFTSNGIYTLSCVVSDMKGGVAIRNAVITAGTGNSRFTISGRVTRQGTGLPGITVGTGGANGTLTDSDGYYTISNLAAGNYSVIAEQYGLAFNNQFNNSITVGPSFTGADFTVDDLPAVSITAQTPVAVEGGAAGVFRIARTGPVAAPKDVFVFAVQGTALKGTVSTNDYYFTPDYVTGTPFQTFTIPAGSAFLDVTVTARSEGTSEGDETVTLVLGADNSYALGSPNNATVTIQDANSALPRVSLTLSEPQIAEDSGGALTATVTRTGSTASALSVSYGHSSLSTATSGVDYFAPLGPITIPIGAASASFAITPINDGDAEPTEAVTFSISSGANFIANAAANSVTARITDDDTQTVTVSAGDATAQEIDRAGMGAVPDTGTFLVTRSGATTSPVTIYYSVAGTALHGTDYDALPGSVVIPAGETQAAVTIMPRVDNFAEGIETVVLSIGTGFGYYQVGATGSATISITDNSADKPLVDVTAYSAIAAEPSTSGIFRLTTKGATGPLQVNYTLGGTAVNGTDYDSGAIWSATTTGSANALRGVWSSSATSVWAVGDGGTILKWNGTAWSAQTSGTGNALRAVWGTSATSLWAVGDSGVILRSTNGTSWSTQTSGTTSPLRAVWGADASNVWAVGDGGTILKWNGTAWSAQTSGITTPLHSAWGNSSSSVWAVGAGGTILKWNGTAWSAQTSGTTNDLRSIWGASSTSLWASGAGGTILRSTNGTSWTAQTSNSTAVITSIWGPDTSNLWAVCDSGTILRTTNSGTAWNAQISNVATVLNCVRGADVNNAWAVGDAGVALNLNSTTSIPLSGTLLIPIEGRTLDLGIRPINDALLEDLETITLTLTADPAYSQWTPLASATMFLRDDDQATVFVDGQIGTGGTDNIVENSTSTTCKFFVSRTGSTAAALTVNYSMSGGATPGADYTSTNLTGSVTIPAGSAGVDISFNTITDTTAEGTESVVFHLEPGTGGANYARGPDASLFITDDEANARSVAFASAGSSGAESTTSVSIPVKLNAPATSAVSVEYNLEAGARSTSYLYGTWVRIVRTGNSYATSTSPDGVTWTTQSTARTITMSSASYLAGVYVTSGASTATALAAIDNVTVTDLSVGGSSGAMTAGDIGTSSAPGGSQVSGGVHQISGCGPDVSTTSSDGCHFVYFPITSSANCTITARILSLTGTSSPKAGVMIRESSAAGAVRMAFYTATGLPAQSYRTTTNATGFTGAGTNPTYTSPVYLRLNRTGNVFTASTSTNGTTFTPVGGGVTLGLSTQLLVGLAASSRNDGLLFTSVFDSVTLSPAPAGAFQDRTVGFVNAQGYSTNNAGVYTITASGAGIMNSQTSTEDECHFLSLPVVGDFTLTARATTVGGQMGLMVRESTNYRARAACLSLVNSPTSSAEWRARLSATESGEGFGIDYTLAPGVLNFDIGDQTKNITLNVTNDQVIEPLEFVNVILKNPVNAVVGGGSSTFTYTIVDDDVISALPAVGFSAPTSSGAENASPVQLPVVLSEPAAGSVTVNYDITAGTAAAGADFSTASGVVTFAAGQTLAYVPLTLLDDTDVETPETVIITLSAPTGAVLGTGSIHTFSISDDDTPVVTIVATDPTAGEAGLETGTFTFYRTGATTSTLNVTYGVTGTATSATDRQGVSTNVTFAIGSSTATRLVIPKDDTLPEVPETTTLTLTAGPGYTVGTPDSATVVIEDDDVNTVTLVASDDIATEAPGNGGQFTLTRTGPLTEALPVTLAFTGNATSGTDYTAISTSQSFAINQSSIVISVSTLTDTTTESPEVITASISSSATYNIGTPSIATVTIQDDDQPPTVFISSPGSKSTIIDATNGLVFSAVGSDDGLPAALTYTWSKLFGPGNITFSTANAATTTATFDMPGVYGVRVTASDGAYTATDDVFVQNGGFNLATWVTQDQGPPATRGIAGESTATGTHTLIGSGTGYTGSNDSGHIAFRQLFTATGDATIIARITSLSGPSTRLGGITMRDTSWKGARRVNLMLTATGGLQMNNRVTANTSGTATTPASGLTLPVWLKLERVSGTVTAYHAPDVAGAPGTYISDGTSSATMGNDLVVGMITSAGAGTSSTATATFDNVTVTPAVAGVALHSEDIGNYVTAGTSAEAAGTTTVTAYGGYDGTGGHFRYQQVWGDCIVTARLVTHVGSFRGAQSGVGVRETTDNGAHAFYGNTTTDGYQAHWRSTPGGSSGTLQNSGSGWVRLVRRGNTVNSYKAPNLGGNVPGTWTLNSGNIPVVLTGPLLVGLVVDSESTSTNAVGTFTNFSVTPLNTAPVVDAGTLAANLPPFHLNATVTDDGMPAPPAALTLTWTLATGPGPVVFADPTIEDTLLTLSADGAHTLRLSASDGDATTFDDLAFTGYLSPYNAWQWAQFPGGSGNADAAMLLDPDYDGIVNLLEYASGTDPETSAPTNIVQDTTTVSSQDYLRLTVTKNPAATDVSYEVQATGDLTDTNSWSSAGLVIETNTTTELRVRDSVAMSSGARRFMRVKVTKL